MTSSQIRKDLKLSRNDKDFVTVELCRREIAVIYDGYISLKPAMFPVSETAFQMRNLVRSGD